MIRLCSADKPCRLLAENALSENPIKESIADIELVHWPIP
jgi:hypothetical protein